MNRRTDPNNSNAFRAIYPRMAKVRPRRLGLAVLNFPPILVARDGTLRRLSHQMRSKSRWRRPSRALGLDEEGWGKCACRGIGPRVSGAKAVGVSPVSDSKTGVLPPSIPLATTTTTCLHAAWRHAFLLHGRVLSVDLSYTL